MAAFDKLAYSFDKPLYQVFYHKAHKQCIKFIREYIEDYSRVLDVGCGTGNFLGKLEKLNRGLTLFGVDESEKMIEVARGKFENIKFITAKAENLPFGNESFNLLATIDAFYCFQDQAKAFSEFYRVLRPGGYLFINTVSIDQFLFRMLTKLGKLSSLSKNSKHLYFRELKALAGNPGFGLIKKDLKFWPYSLFSKCWFFVFKK